MSAKQKLSQSNAWQSELERHLGQQRARLRSALEAQRERLQEIEQTLDARFGTIRELLEEVAERTQTHDTALETKLGEVKRDEQRLSQQRADLAKQRGHIEALYTGWEQSQQQAQMREMTVLEEVARGLEELRQREASLQQQKLETFQLKVEVDTANRICAERQKAILEAEQHLEQKEVQLHELESMLHEQRLTLEHREDRLRRQRTSVARELRHRRQELEQWQQQLSQRSSEHMEYASEAVTSSREHQRRQHQAEDADLAAKLEEAQYQLDRARDQSARAEKKLADLDRELREAWNKVDALEAELKQQGRLEHAAHHSQDQEELEALREELAELKGELKRSRAAAKAANETDAKASPAALYNGTEMSWESRKKSLLAQLETDFSDTDPQDKADKLTIRAVIRQTEDALNAKEAEIEELKRLLDEQSSRVGEFAVGAAAVAQLIDTDELVQLERQKLRELQEKLLEESKNSEIEISMERAKLARERLELEEKLQRLEKIQAQNEPIQINTRSESGKKQPGGSRWLSRLGLGEGDKK